MNDRASPKSALTITIRGLHTLEDLQKVEHVEREVWGLADADIFPLTAIIASQAAGHLWIGAFDGEDLAGFAYGFPSLEHGELRVHSHMLAVREPYRDLDLGYRLKLAQRECALGIHLRGISVAGPVKDLSSAGRLLNDSRLIKDMTWTFDPLQSRNAHFNFNKLGVVSDDYRKDFYGPETSSVLHRNGTDRLWVRWPMTGRRVKQRLQGTKIGEETQRLLKDLEPLISVDSERTAKRGNLVAALSKRQVAIQIPDDIATLELCSPDVAQDWRNATRWAFTKSLAAGFFVAEFFRETPETRTGTYLLRRGDIDDYAS